ncbi:MAG: hypothetical protein WCL49_05805 [bacterium]
MSTFKTCSHCRHDWSTREKFLADPLVQIIGYQVNFDHLKAGLFLFNHLNEHCLTTISLKVDEFSSLFTGDVFEDRLTGSAECPGYCLNKNSLKSCPAKCECNYVREVIQLILKYPKKTNVSP